VRTKFDIYVFFINRKTVERDKIDAPNTHGQLTIADFKYSV